MDVAKEKVVETPHNQLLKIAELNFPDRKFTAQEGEEVQDDLEQAILELIQNKDKEIEDNNSKNEQLVQMFITDPKSANFLTKWVETGDPRSALIETFGDELSELGTEEGRNQFADELKTYRSKREETLKLDKEADENWNKSLEALDKWGTDKGLTDEQKPQVLLRLIKITEGGLQNIYEEEDFEMVLKEMNYSKDIENARAEGEVAGRNAKIAEKRKERNDIETLPPSPNGQGLKGEEHSIDKKKNPWSGLI